MELDLERQLQQHARSVQSLASALLGDADAGQDVAQETVLLARDHQPPASSLRAWMLRVGRRLAGRWRRTELRRQQREHGAARPERQPSAADDAQRAELLQAIANAVLALPAPLREVVLLRHYDGLPPRAIAARLSLSVEAVETRLRRAHAQLRERLQNHRPGAEWRAGLMLFAVPGAGTLLPGAVAVSAKSKGLIAAAAVLLLLGCVAWWAWPSPMARPAAAPGTVVADAGANPVQAASPAAAPTEAAPDRVAVTPADAAPSWSATVTGRVVDEYRHPVEGAHVVAQCDCGGRAEALSRADGRFELAVPVAGAWAIDGEVMAVRDGRAAIGSFFAGVNSSTRHDAGVLALLPAGSLEVLACRGAEQLPAARITAMRAIYMPSLRRRQAGDAEGRATLADLAPSLYCVTAEAADGSWMFGEANVIAGRTTRITLDLQTCLPVDVDVLARRDRRPIAGAQLEAMYEGSTDRNSFCRVPLDRMVPLPRTDANGHARLFGLCRGQRIDLGANHPDWRPTTTVNALPTDWNAAAPRSEVLLDDLASVTWRLVDGEVPVPPDGTMFLLHDRHVALRDGRLRLRNKVVYPGGLLALGPGCYAQLSVTADGSPPPPARVQRSRQLRIELRDDGDRPLAGWLLWVFCSGQGTNTMRDLRTDSDGIAVAENLSANQATVQFKSEGGSPMWDLGKIDLSPGDGTLTLRIGPPRRVRAQVFVDDVPGLPGSLLVRADMARVGDLAEDPLRGVIEFDVWQREPGKACQLLCNGTVDQTLARATLPEGTAPAEIEFRLQSRGGGVLQIAVAPPLDAPADVRVEQFYDRDSDGKPRPQGRGDWTRTVSIQLQAAEQVLQHVNPGRYRLRDELSGTIGPEVTLAGDGNDASLTLDLSRVVTVAGRVITADDGRSVAVELRDVVGKTLLRRGVAADGSFLLSANLDREGLVLVAVRGTTTSPPLPVTGTMTDVQLVLPD